MSKISNSDIVEVKFFNRPFTIMGEVLHMPNNTGDSWHIKTSDEQLYYVQNYEYIKLIARKR